MACCQGVQPQLVTGLLWKMGIESLPKEAFRMNGVDPSRGQRTVPAIHGGYRADGLLETSSLKLKES